MEKILIPLLDADIAPRFDLATDVLIVTVVRNDKEVLAREDKLVVLDSASPEAVCRLVITEGIKTVICAGIEGEYYDFLRWKGVRMYDDVVGPAEAAVHAHLEGNLQSGCNV
jgi:predicted Fe-Mo cluster-binding NifX family protein